MKKSHILFSFAGLGLILFGMMQYDANAACYEIVPPQGQMNTMLLDKCKGRTLILIKEDIDQDKDGTSDGYIYRWSTIKFLQRSEPFWESDRESN